MPEGPPESTKSVTSKMYMNYLRRKIEGFLRRDTTGDNAPFLPEHRAILQKIYALLPETFQWKDSAGGIRSYQDALAMIRAGATRIGASAGVKIVQEARAKESK